ncbi:MAG: hypothetical protein GWP41_05420 [Planctomycetia bacterium]|nr:hypothetical protein [Planctomycetia bacterium]NCF98998.1 hypothetical protein [Planctomycetia bacterium]
MMKEIVHKKQFQLLICILVFLTIFFVVFRGLWISQTFDSQATIKNPSELITLGESSSSEDSSRIREQIRQKSGFPREVHSSVERSAEDLVEAPQAMEGNQEEPWRTPMSELLHAGRAGTDPSHALESLLLCQPHMGDELVWLLHRGNWTAEERRVLLIALGTALSMKPVPENLWFDRRGAIAWVSRSWIEGVEEVREIERWLWQEDVLDPSLGMEFLQILEEEFQGIGLGEGLGKGVHARLQKIVIHALLQFPQDEYPAWLEEVTQDWLHSSSSDLQSIAMAVLGHLCSWGEKPVRAAIVQKLSGSLKEEALPLLKSLLSNATPDSLPWILNQSGPLMESLEFRGEELLEAFQRCSQLDLEELIYQKGSEPVSEGYRAIVVYGSLGALDTTQKLSIEWAEVLEKVARTDPSQMVRGLALRVRALSWSNGSEADLLALIRQSDVSLSAAQIVQQIFESRD